MADPDISNRHTGWIALWAFIGLAMVALGIALADLAAKPHWWWAWFPVGGCGILLLFSIWAAASPFTQRWPLLKPSSEDDVLKKELYNGLVRLGDSCLRNLEGAVEQTTYEHWSQSHMNQLVQFVDAYVRSCQYWMEVAQDNMAKVVSESDVTLFISNPYTRPRPKYVENEPELGIWNHTAGGLDWLRAELAKL